MHADYYQPSIFTQKQWDLLRLPVYILVGWLALYFTSFFHLVNLDPNDEKIELDLQLLIKLAVLAASGIYVAWSFACDARVRQVLFSFPCAGVFIVGLIILAASAVSSIPTESAVSAGSALVCLTLVISVAVKTSRWFALSAIFLGQATFVLGSWFLYLFVPELGVFLEPIADGEFFERMGGLAHPNSLGQLSGLAVVTAFSILVTGKIKGRYLQMGVTAIGLMAVLALVFSISRSSILATVVATAWGLRYWWLSGSRIVITFLATAALFMLIFSMLATTSGEDFLQQKIFSKITKSGSVEELSSGTGRNVIWSYTWSLIQQRPILGYGAGTSKDLLAEYSLYTHNMFLNVALSAGLIAGFGLMMLVLYGLLRTLYNAAPVPDCILVFLAINGLTENVVFENIASGSTALLMLTLAWHLLPEEYQGEPISPTLNVS